jgi:tetratricopeptide (TPR) repeat protein
MPDDQTQHEQPPAHQETRDILETAQLHHQAGKLEQAILTYQRALNLEPDNGETYYHLGLALKKLNHLPAAVAHLQKAITLQVQRAGVFAELADTLLSLNRFQDAESMARAAVTLDPEHRLAIHSLAYALLNLGRFEEARTYGELLISKSPNNAEDHTLLAVINGDSSHYEEAILHAEKAIALNSDVAKPYAVICNAYLATGRWQEARQYIEQALEREPDNRDYITAKADTLGRQGKYKQAFALVAPLMRGEKTISSNTLQIYARLSKHFGQQQKALEMLEKVVVMEELPVRPRSSLLNALGRLYDDVGLYDKAFATISKSNELRTHRYDAGTQEANTRQFSQWFTPERMQNTPKTTHGSKRPIFIVGMPRSGTSLTERILARHPDVFGAGELTKLENIALIELPNIMGTGMNYPEYLQDLTTVHTNQAAQTYLDTLDRLAQNNEARVTDKMPMNFLYLGLIALLFPQACIIHCMRNPMATGLSCYFEQFGSSSTLGFSQNLQTIGHYYKQYEHFMAHWHRVLPMPIYDLRYEALVTDPETEIRKLLEFCDLPWHPGCLEPHKAKETTATASYDQVRKPIHNKSVTRWEHYEKHLQPLKEILGLT